MGVVKHTHTEDKSQTFHHTKISLKVTGPIANEIEMKKIMVKADELFGYSEDILNERQSNADVDPNQTDMDV